VHAGAGGLGQAAISIALHMGCTVYTTVGSKEKREFLKKKFPKVTPIFMKKMLALKFVLSIVSRHLIGQF
jgi:NADPH:quinone reductase and related Zn-dependent oxidoreductases